MQAARVYRDRPGCSATGDDLIRTGTFEEGVKQGHLQVAAMNRELRHVIAGEAPGRLAVDELAEAVVEAIFARGDRDLAERILKSERHQFARGVRQDIDADADRL